MAASTRDETALSTTEALLDVPAVTEEDEETDLASYKTMLEQVLLILFVVIPFLAVLAAVPVLWVTGFLTWRDAVIAVTMYAITGHGITVGFHRYFTHRAFRAKRWLRVTLAVAGSMAIQGSVIQWVSDHRKHHRFSDREGDPHSPFRYGNNARSLAKGFAYAHVGWLF